MALAPRDAELGVAGETMSPGLAKMAARAAEAVPFTRGAGLGAEGLSVDLRQADLARQAAFILGYHHRIGEDGLRAVPARPRPGRPHFRSPGSASAKSFSS